jgi:hypothetical protein
MCKKWSDAGRNTGYSMGQSSEFVSLCHLTCHSSHLGQYTFSKRLLKIQQQQARGFFSAIEMCGAIASLLAMFLD